MPIVVPVIVRFAVRAAPVVFGATEKLTTPLPVPEAPAVTVRNAALLTAVHAQPVFVVTEMDADPPWAGNEVVVVPVMIAHELPPGPVGESSSPHAMVTTSRAADKIMRVRCEN